MVFVEIQSEYIKNFSKSHEQEALYLVKYILEYPNIPGGMTESISKELSDLIYAISIDKQSEIESIISSYSVKTPDPSSPWIYNDYLIFLLTIVVLKFKMDGRWLVKAISQRKFGEIEQKLTIDFFISALNGIKDGKGISAFLIVLKYFQNPATIDDNSIKEAIQELNYVSFPKFRSEFLNILHLKAFFVVMDMKSLRNYDEDLRLSRFESRFQHRLKKISTSVVYILFILFLIICYLLTTKLLSVEENVRNKIITIVGFGGITILEIFKAKKVLHKKVFDFLCYILGYSN